MYSIGIKGDNLLKLLNEGKDALKSAVTESNLPIGYLEGIAKIRFVCSFVTDLFYQLHGPQSGFAYSLLNQLLQQLQNICEDSSLNTMESGPGIFFLKQVARQHGVSFLNKICASKDTEWIMPVHLRKTDQVFLTLLFSGRHEE